MNARIRRCSPVVLALGLLAACDRAPGPQPQEAAAPPAELPGPVLPPPKLPEQGANDAHSRYTALVGETCGAPVRQGQEGVSAHWSCEGTAGYGIVVHESDARMSIDVIAPDGQAHPLNLWWLAGGAFSDLAETAEWRMAGGDGPVALIVRYQALTDPERSTSYLVVARLVPAPCLVALVAPGPDQNLRARLEADRAGGLACRSARDF